MQFPKFRLGLGARLALLALVLFADKYFLYQFVDVGLADAAQGFGEAVRVAQHFGFRFLVAFAAAVMLFAYVRGAPALYCAVSEVPAAPIRRRWALLHMLLLAPLAFLSYLLYRFTPTDLSIAAVAASWISIGAAATLAAMLALLPGALWITLGRSLGSAWWYALLASLCGTAVTQQSQQLWHSAATLTFNLVRLVLMPIVPSLAADPTDLVLSTDRFAVQVVDFCSGLEGVGLTLAFSTAWLICFRREYRFPRALLLIPAGMAVSFALNVVRISVLFLIGEAGFPDTAMLGFHSQAGWIAFIAVAGGLVVLSRRSAWFSRVATARESQADNPTAVYLMPLLAILAAGMLSGALSGRFEYLYPLRLPAAAIAFWTYRRALRRLEWRWSWRALAVGSCVFVMWLIAAHFLIPASGMPGELAGLSPAARGLWLAGRFTASVLTVPIAEELAYRGYLMRRLMSGNFESVSYASIRWPAICASALIFGLAHGAMWLPATAAGLAFGGLLVNRGHLGEAAAAHATTNALIALTVLYWHQWQLW